MAHHLVKSGYSRLVRRLNKFPQGAPASEALYAILKMLFSEREAQYVSMLPIKPFTAQKASKIWKLNITETQKILDELASRAILVDIDHNGESEYALPPPMAGFFEFSLMRINNDLDQKVLSELFYQYLNVEEDFVRDLFTRGDTQLGRTFVKEPALSEENALYVLDYERAGEVVKTASYRAVSMCYCRHKKMHIGEACNAPMDICLTFDISAASLSKHGFARAIDVVECLDLLQLAYENKLVQFGSNMREDVNFICNCCGCCCEAMLTAKRFAILNPVHTTNFIPEINIKDCNGCGKCVNACPVEAMTLVSANDPHKPNVKRAKLNEDICLGCGVCVNTCSKACISLKSREKRVITPLNSTHKTVLMAIERGVLQNLIFDNQVLWSHRALAGVLGVILKLPPIKQLLASQQVKSRYLETMIKRNQN